MNLRKLDEKMVRIEDLDGDVYEGTCTYNNSEYNYHEWGREEESLQMSYIHFYKSYIKKVKKIDEFSSPYGKLEELVLDSGVSFVEEVLDSEDDISIYRLLLCLEDNIGSFSKEEKNRLKKQINNLIKYNNNNEIKEKANKINELLDT